MRISNNGGVKRDLPKRWQKGSPVEVVGKGDFVGACGYVDLGKIDFKGRVRVRFNAEFRQHGYRAAYLYGNELRILSLLEEMAMVAT